MEYAFGRTKRVYEKEGKLIGTKGENGHPYDGEFWVPIYVCPTLVNSRGVD